MSRKWTLSRDVFYYFTIYYSYVTFGWKFRFRLRPVYQRLSSIYYTFFTKSNANYAIMQSSLHSQDYTDSLLVSHFQQLTCVPEFKLPV